METISPFPVTPRTTTSHLRHRAPIDSPTMAIATTTRNLHAPETQHMQPLSAPASQESFVSVQSQASSVARQSQSSSSNLSQLTNYTDPNSPEVIAASSNKQRVNEQHTSAPHDVPRMRTPETLTKANGNVDYASPMSIASPVATNGAKRTASGYVKNSSATSQPSTPILATSTPAGRRPRTESVSSTGSRAGELAQQLKTRLGYAMAKVQHGWEHKSIAEVEVLARMKMSPGRHVQHETERGGYEGLQQQHRPASAGLSNGAARLSMYELQSPQYQHGFDGTAMATSPPSKRRSGTYGAFASSRQQQPQGSGYAGLQPPAVIRQTSAADSLRHYQPPPSLKYGLNSNSTTYTTATAMSPPRTPVATVHARSHAQPHIQVDHRPATVRTTTQTAEAERDALQALFQLGSPRASQPNSQSLQQQSEAMSGASSTQASPLRTEYSTPRRVTFAATSDGEGSSESSAEAREESAER